MKQAINRLIPRLYGLYFNALALFSMKTAAEKAFTLFCTPRKGKVLPVQKEFLEEAEHDMIEVGGMGLQTYQWTGNKETVLLLHGWESNTFRWRNLIRFLSKEGYNVVAFDAPAHGKSSGAILNVPLYAECADHIIKKFKPQYVVGHSVGGMTALYYQYQYNTNSVKKLVSIGAPSELPDIMEQYQRILKFNNRVLNALDMYFRNHFGFAIEDFSTSRFATQLNIEGLLIHDELDKIAPFSASEKVHAQWDKSKLIRTKGLGHSLHQDEVNLKIIDFLKS